MKLKYEDYHINLPCDCPDKKKCGPVIRKSFRFFHENVHHINNFLPVLLIDTSRKINNCKGKCNGYALSFFTSLAFAEKKYLKIAEHAPLFVETVGEFIAECDIREIDGIAESPGIDGHFDLHEFEGANFSGRFTLIKRVRL